MPPDVSESTEEDEEMRRYFVHPLRLWIKNELLFVSWNVTRSELFYVGIFDLNQWYSSHTAARIPSGGLCPFWVAIPVEPPSKTDTFHAPIAPYKLGPFSPHNLDRFLPITCTIFSL